MREITIYVVVGILCLCRPIPTYNQCLDPDPPIPNVITTIITDCGEVFDLCMDFYNIGNTKPDTFVLNVFANDGDIDYCASDSIAGATTKHGKIIRLSNCQWAFIPGPTFTNAIIDSFDYGLVINDSCINDPDYCAAGKGKFWTIYSRYEGTKIVKSITATSKKGNGSEVVNIVADFPLSNGEYFFAEGTHLANGQSNWTFTFNYQSGPPDVFGVHTSCSAPILELTHPVELQNGEYVSIGNIMTPVSGCVATNGNQANCNTSPQHFDRNQIMTRAEVTTQFVDTTRVYLVSNNTVLDIQFGGFEVESRKTNNLVSWEIISVIGEEKLNLQKSYNGSDFLDVIEHRELSAGRYNYKDLDIKKSVNYYRLSVTNYDGGIRYSDIILNRRPEISRSLSIFPRPSNDIITIRIDGSDSDIGIAGVDVYDLNGKLMVSRINISDHYSTYEFSGLDLPAGLYMIRVKLSDGDILHDKLIKK